MKIISKAFLNRKKRFLFLFSIMLLLSCKNEINAVNELVNRAFKKEEFGEQVEILITKRGKPNIKITAPEAVRNYEAKPYTEFPKGMTLKVFNEEGEQESSLTAKYGKMGDGSDEMIAKDSVVVSNKKGETLNTEHLIWDKKVSVIRTEGFVKIHTEDEIIYGDGFISNDDFSEYTITNIHGIVKVKNGL